MNLSRAIGFHSYSEEIDKEAVRRRLLRYINLKLRGNGLPGLPIDDPTGEGVSRYGGTVAAPVFSEIAGEAMKYMGVKPSIVPRRALRSKGPMASVRYGPAGAG